MADNTETMLARIDERMQNQGEKLDDVGTRLTQLVDKANGMNTRVDRIEQKEVGRSRILWLALTATIGGWVSLLMRKIGA